MKHLTYLSFPLLALFSACTVDTVVDSGGDPSGETQEPGLELHGQFLNIGMTEAQATACSSLGELVEAYKSEYAELHPDELPPPWLHLEGETADVYVERATVYQSQCESWLPNLGWDGCATSGNPVVHTPPPECTTQGLNHMHCLADESLETVDECDAQGWNETCNSTPTGRDLAAELGCAVAGDSHDEETNQSGVLVTYGFELSECPDGHAYRFTCPPPTSDCALTCECEIDGQPSGMASLTDFSADVAFTESVWAACGFPAVL